MDLEHAQLSSAASTLDEVTRRLVAIADAHRESDSDDLSADIDEVERSLRTASRKLDRLLRRLG